MKKYLIIAALAAFAGTAFAQNTSWIGNSYIAIGQSSDALTWYKLSGWADNQTEFDGRDLGEVSSLIFGGQVWTKQRDAAQNPAYMGYKLDGVDTVIPLAWVGYNRSGFTEDSLAYGSNVFGYEDYYEDWTYEYYNSTYDAGSQLITIDLSALDPGEHELGIWFVSQSGIDEEGNPTYAYDSNGGVNYTATFTTRAVPEPATMGLMGLGALALALRRKFRK